MQVSIEKLEGLERRMTVQVPAEQIDQQVEDRLLSLSRRVKLDGFRPGKAPLRIVKRLYGPQVREEVIGEVLQNSLRDALTQENLKPVSGPKIETKSVSEGVDMEYSATFEVFPEFDVAGIDAIKVERPTAEITEADIDTMIDSLRKQRTIWTAVDRPCQQGDKVTVDFIGKRDGEEVAGGRGEDVTLVLGAGHKMKEFEEKLNGLRASEETEFDINFPEDYFNKDLAGKLIHFVVQVKAVAEPSLPEVDEEFAAALDVKEGGVEGLRKALRKNMERELQNAIKAIVKRQVMQQLLDANSVPLPQTMIDQEIEHLAKQMRFPQRSQSGEEWSTLRRELFEPEARRRVALGLILSRLVAAQGLRLDESRVQNRLASIASTYQESEEVIEWYNRNPYALGGVRALALEDQVVDWLLERASIVEKPGSFDEIMKPQRTTSSFQETTD
jgi:trigger factor